MIDLEKIISAIEKAKKQSEEYGLDHILVDFKAADMILELLKEQDAKTQGAEPVKPHYNERTNWYECGACRYSMTSGMHCRSELIPAYKVGFCAKCGRSVKWDE